MFARRNLSITDNNYTMTKREGIAMVYCMKKYHHYLLKSHLKLYMDHYASKYLINNLDFGERICHWLLLFQEYDFELILKPTKVKVGPDHLSRITLGE